ncbi:hypothetical protein [Paracoccus sp. (in: a-proteobacteria)]|uniref:hypothetical protein n=1 Tax=Paracoccus sp. TaxID=267 RepID=UPI0028AFD5F0|nr:hypothetical protein [Paracoccus sp. (in: a-proteobacteria)]
MIEPSLALQTAIGDALAAAPEHYRWIAVWWRLSALESQIPEQYREYARGQMALTADMERRPQHYKTKPAGQTD